MELAVQRGQVAPRVKAVLVALTEAAEQAGLMVVTALAEAAARRGQVEPTEVQVLVEAAARRAQVVLAARRGLRARRELRVPRGLRVRRALRVNHQLYLVQVVLQ